MPLCEPGQNTLRQLLPEEVFDAKPQEDLMIAFFCRRWEQSMWCNRLPLSTSLYCLIILVDSVFGSLWYLWQVWARVLYIPCLVLFFMYLVNTCCVSWWVWCQGLFPIMNYRPITLSCLYLDLDIDSWIALNLSKLIYLQCFNPSHHQELFI